MLLHIKKRKPNEEPSPMDLENEGDMEVLPMMLDCICDISSIRLNLPNNLMKVENQIMVKETLKNVYF